MDIGSAVWNGSTNLDWNEDTNWTPNQHPENGHVATFLGTEAGGLPTSNLPTTGTINFWFAAAYDIYLGEIMNGASVGIVTINHPDAVIQLYNGVDGTFTTCELYQGECEIYAAGGAGDVTLGGGELKLGGADLNGDVLAIADATVDWGTGSITGSLNADGHTITHLNAIGRDLVCDNAGTLDLGSTTDTGINVDINVAGIVTLGADLWCGDFTVTSGMLIGTGYTISASGDYLGEAAAVNTGVSVDLTGTGDCRQSSLSYAAGGYPQIICAADGQVTTFPDPAYVGKITLGPGTADGTGHIFLRYINTDDPLEQDPANTLTVEKITIQNYTSSISQKSFRSNGELVVITNQANHPLTFTGSLDIAGSDLEIEGSASANTARVIFEDGVSLACRDIVLGLSTTDRGGSLTLGGSASFRNCGKSGDNGTGNAVVLGSSHVECSGSMDADNVTISSNESFPPEIVFGPGGKITNTDDKGVNFAVGVHGDANVLSLGSNDANIVDYTNNQSAPGSLMTMGIGGGRLIVP